ncbi:hypothetical protein AB0D49_33410 [Streptomyces sp. NPDC048290]|uniref:hypothetical protein n=1 Tax=Streptomyces sp. NPDC048290 TaxID=3155811 RepID=UPI0034349658
MNRIARLDRSLSGAGEAPERVAVALRAYGFPAEFVPVAVGGRLQDAEELHQVVRTVLRRGLPEAAWHTLSGFPSAVRIWSGGSRGQQHRAAALLLRGDRMAPAGGGPAPPHDTFTARTGPGGLRLSAAAAAPAPPHGCHALVVTARHHMSRTGRDHTTLLLDPRDMPPGGHSRTLGWDAVVDEPGAGLELALRAARLTHGVHASAVIARFDSLLRGTIEPTHATDRPEPAAPSGPGVLAGAFLDLLVSDCVTLCAARAIHLLPDWASVYAAAAGYLAERLLTETGHDLTTVLEGRRLGGAPRYRRFAHRLGALTSPLWPTEDEVPAYAVLVARLPTRPPGHVLTASDPRTRIPETLFQPDAPLPALDLARPAHCPRAAGTDAPLESLAHHATRIEHAGDTATHPGCHAALSAQLDRLAGAITGLGEACAPLAAAGHKALLGPYARSLADRYALLVAAAACVGVWWQQRAHTRGFLAETCWLTAALHRIAGLLDTAPTEPPLSCLDRVHQEMLARFDGGLSYDLRAVPLAAPITLGD